MYFNVLNQNENVAVIHYYDNPCIDIKHKY